PKMETLHQIPLSLSDKAVDIAVQKIPFQGRKAPDPLMGQVRIDDPRQGGTRAHGTTDQVESGVIGNQYFFAAPYPQGIAAPFGQQVKFPKTAPQPLDKFRFVPLSVVGPGHKMEPHSMFMGQGQGRVVPPTVLQLLSPDDPDGPKARFPSRTGQGRNMVGMGPAKAEHDIPPQGFGRFKVVLELSELVPRDQGM